MTTVERYDEQGEPIFALEGGSLKQLWKHLAIINEINTNEGVEAVTEKFDYNEFYKRLYLSRAELDVTNSIIQLLLGEADDNNINLSCVQHENETNFANNEKVGMSSTQSVYLYKHSLIKEVSKDLRMNAESLAKNRREEHEVTSKLLLKLREKYRWNLVRISNSEQIQVHIDYQVMIPIIGIDFSPLTLFKDQSSREQYNYKLHHQIGCESIALVVRSKSGLGLLFQQKMNSRQLTISACVKNLKTGAESKAILFKPFPYEIVKYFGENLSDWHSHLMDARDRELCLNIMKLISIEAALIPKDHVDYNLKNLNIYLNDEISFSINFTDSFQDDNVSTLPSELYNLLLKEYIINHGNSVNCRSIRSEILENY